MAAEAEREAKSMRPASGLVLVPVSMSALAVPMVPAVLPRCAEASRVGTETIADALVMDRACVLEL